MVKTLLLSIIDDDDYDLIAKYSWSIDSNGYARHNLYIQNQKYKRITIHRLVMNAKINQQIDHINGNKLDNRKHNLRFCDKYQNAMNCKIHKHNTSGYKGVCWHKQSKKWRAYIVINDKQLSLGLFNNKKQAANAYNKKAKELFGEFARTNKV